MRAASCSEAFPISADRLFLKFGGANFYAAVSILSASFGAGFPPLPHPLASPLGPMAKGVPPYLYTNGPRNLSAPKSQGYISNLLILQDFTIFLPPNRFYEKSRGFYGPLFPIFIRLWSDAHEFNRVIFNIFQGVGHRQSDRNGLTFPRRSRKRPPRGLRFVAG